MVFSGQYLTYNEYRQLGGTLDIMPFNLLEIKARENIDRETQGRLKGATTVPSEVKVCVYDLVEGMAFDGLYKDVKPEEKEKYVNEKIYNQLVSVIYNGTPLLYRGVM